MQTVGTLTLLLMRTCPSEGGPGEDGPSEGGPNCPNEGVPMNAVGCS